MQCPRCAGPMHACPLDSHAGTPVAIDVCRPCQAFWFDAFESPRLSPGSTLSLFRLIGEDARRPIRFSHADVSKCPRCRGRLRLSHDKQGAVGFSYLSCPNGHGRLTTFVDFLKEKQFIKPLTAAQLDDLRQHVTSIHCSSCGGPIDIGAHAACGHCGTPVSTLDVPHAERLLAQLAKAEDPHGQRAIDPALPLRLARARREVELAFDGQTDTSAWYRDAETTGLVSATLAALARWMAQPGGGRKPGIG